MENMVKDVRVGTVYHCGGAPYSTPASCSGGAPFFAFRPSGEVAGSEVVFRLNNGAIERSDDGGTNFLAITSPDVTVEYLEFRVWGAESGDGLQPRVKISVSGIAGVKENVQTDFNIQATATQRLIDS
jgi:hypothetical protein